jgi:hypothetical protein
VKQLRQPGKGDGSSGAPATILGLQSAAPVRRGPTRKGRGPDAAWADPKARPRCGVVSTTTSLRFSSEAFKRGQAAAPLGRCSGRKSCTALLGGEPRSPARVSFRPFGDVAGAEAVERAVGLLVVEQPAGFVSGFELLRCQRPTWSSQPLPETRQHVSDATAVSPELDTLGIAITWLAWPRPGSDPGHAPRRRVPSRRWRASAAGSPAFRAR